MPIFRTTLLLIAICASAWNANLASSQSDPSLFGTVYNIGDVPVGSMFDVNSDDIPGVVATADEVGNRFSTVERLITPEFFGGNTLGSDSQLNLFENGDISFNFNIGPTDGSGSNIELNVIGGTAGSRLEANSGSTVNVSGGSLSGFIDANSGSTFNITGGSLDSTFNANGGSIVNISGGSLDSFFSANPGSTVNISGGTLGDFFTSNRGAPVVSSTVNVSGGTIGDYFTAFGYSVINLSGGAVGDLFSATRGSTINMSGGTVGVGFNASNGSTLNISGGEFELNGNPVSDLSAGFAPRLPNNGVFSGVLADGSVFLFYFDGFRPGTTTLDAVAVPPSSNPGVLSSGTFTKGVRAGETLTVTDAGTLGRNFAVYAGTLNIEGGSVGDGLEVAFSEVRISGGSVGEGFFAVADSKVKITGGSIGRGFIADSGTTVDISGGEIGDFFLALDTSTINLFGTAFFLDGVEVSALALGEAFTITDRDVTLTGFLADGSAIEFELNSEQRTNQSRFSPGATLTVTLVPEPTSSLLFVLGGLAVATATRRSQMGRLLDRSCGCAGR